MAIAREQLVQAELLVTRLIATAPDFAEAYNQRAIIYFHQGRFADSVKDCESVLARNPYHFGRGFGDGRVSASAQASTRRVEAAAPGVEAAAVPQLAP